MFDGGDSQGGPGGQMQIADLPLNKLIAEKCKRSFKYFMRQAWPTAEPGSALIHGWHMDVICDHIQACVEGRIQNLIIAIPPRHSKSTIVSVLFPAWLWLRDPGRRTLFVSFAARLSDRDSRKCRNLIESVWYQELFGTIFKLAGDSNTIRRFDNDMGGMRFASSVDGTLTGEGANYVVADDMHNLSEIMSDLKREKANEIWDTTLQSRLNPPIEEGHFIIIAQRGHSSDLIGHVKSKEAKAVKDGRDPSYTVLELPAEFEAANRCRTYLGKDEHGQEIYWEDPRTEDGELLWPAGCPKHYLERQKINLGAFAYAAQYQQRPVPKEGGTFNLDWFPRYWPGELPNVAAWDDSCISIDMNFGTTKTSDIGKLSYVVATSWCRVGARFFLLDMARGQWKYTESKREILIFVFTYPQIWAIYVENKANGPAVMDDLMETEGLSGIIPVDPKEFGGDKLSRAHSITPLCEARNVYLPHEESDVGRRIMDEVLLELGTFPLGATNDIVDTITQALNKMRQRYTPMGLGVGKDEKSFEEQLRTARNIEQPKVPGVEYPPEPEVAPSPTLLNGRPINIPADQAAAKRNPMMEQLASASVEDNPGEIERRRTFRPGQGWTGNVHDQLFFSAQVAAQEENQSAVRGFWRGMMG